MLSRRLFICKGAFWLCYNTSMRSSRRLMLMVAGLLILCSNSFAWIDGQMPINASFGKMLSTLLSSVTSGSIMIDIAIIDQISMAAVLFVIGVICLIAAVLGSRAIAIISTLLSALIVAMWAISTGISIDSLFNHFNGLGTGTHLAILSIILSLVALILPRLHLPGRSI